MHVQHQIISEYKSLSTLSTWQFRAGFTWSTGCMYTRHDGRIACDVWNFPATVLNQISNALIFVPSEWPSLISNICKFICIYTYLSKIAINPADTKIYKKNITNKASILGKCLKNKSNTRMSDGRLPPTFHPHSYSPHLTIQTTDTFVHFNAGF